MNKFILLLLFVLSSIPTLAQEKGSGGFLKLKSHFLRIRIVGGPSVASMRYTRLLPVERPANTFGFGLGLETDYIINDHFRINGKMLFERKGGRFNVDAGTYDSVTQIHGVAKGAGHEIDRLDYLTMPFMLNYSLGRKVRINVGFGPFISYLLKAQHTHENTILKQVFIHDVTSDFRKTDFGFTLALGVDFPLKKDYQVSISVTDSWGLVNLTPTYGITQKTNALYILISIPFPNIF